MHLGFKVRVWPLGVGGWAGSFCMIRIICPGSFFFTTRGTKLLMVSYDKIRIVVVHLVFIIFVCPLGWGGGRVGLGNLSGLLSNHLTTRGRKLFMVSYDRV